MFQISEELPSAVNKQVMDKIREVVTERFGKDVHDVIIRSRKDIDGEIHLIVEVQFKNAEREFGTQGGLFGLTGLIRKVLSGELAGAFPVIRPVFNA